MNNNENTKRMDIVHKREYIDKAGKSQATFNKIGIAFFKEGKNPVLKLEYLPVEGLQPNDFLYLLDSDRFKNKDSESPSSSDFENPADKK